jgi:hypothetical protein
MERTGPATVDLQNGNVVMHRLKPPPIRNKIELADPGQVRAWTKRLGISPDSLRTTIDKVGNAIAAVTKEVELGRSAKQTSRAVKQIPPAEGELPAST